MAFQPDAFQIDAFETGEDPDKVGSETGTGADDATLAVSLSDAETGAGDDDASVADDETNPAGSETGAGADDASLTANLSDADAGSGSEEATLEATLDDTEGGSGSDDAEAGILQTGAETGAGAESATSEAAPLGAEAGVGADASPQLDKSEAGPGAETGAGGETGRVSRFGAAPAPIDLDVEILYDNIDIAADVLYGATRFVSAANGRPGTATLRVRDEGHVYGFTVGQSLQCRIAGVAEWTGYVSEIRRGYFLIDAKDPSTRVRFFELSGLDLNALFTKRVLHDKATPTNLDLTAYPAGAQDDVIVKQYMDDHLDLGGDGLTKTLIEHVGTPSTDSRISGSAGWNWQNLMQYLTRETGGVYYIDPDRNVVLTDVDTPSAPFGISDRPGAGQVGCRDLEIDSAGDKMANDALVWGAGQGRAEMVFKRVEDTDSITAHHRWQVGQFVPSVWQQASIDRIADSHVYGSPQNKRGGKDDAVAARATIFTPGIRVGMKVPIESEVFGFTDVLPCRTVELDFVGRSPRWRATLSHEIDTPWTTYGFWYPPIPGRDGPEKPDWNWPDPDGPGGLTPPRWWLPDPWPPFDPCAIVSGGVERRTETFSRVTDPDDPDDNFGLGVCEINGSNWWVTGGGGVHADGTKAVSPNTASTIVSHGFQLNGDDPVSGLPIADPVDMVFPLDVTFRLRFSVATETFSVWIGYFFDPGYDDQFVQVDLSVSAGQLIVGAAAMNQIEETTGASGVGTLAGVVSNEFWVHMRSDADGGIKVRTWFDGDPEPGTWDIAELGVDMSAAVPLLNEVQTWWDDPTVGGFISFDELGMDVSGGPITVGELMGLFSQTDMFSRTVAPGSGSGDPESPSVWVGAWGIGPLGEWRHGFSGASPDELSVADGHAIVDGFPQYSFHWVPNPLHSEASYDSDFDIYRETVPLEVVVHWKAILSGDTSWNADTYFGRLSDPEDPNNWGFQEYFEVFSEWVGSGGEDPGVVRLWTNIGGPFDPHFVESGIDIPAADSNELVEVDFFVKCRIDGFGTRMAIWRASDPEPMTWLNEINDEDPGSRSSPHVIALRTEMGSFEEGYLWRVDKIEVRGDSCGTEVEPPPDPPRGAVCEDLTQRTDPPGYPTGPTYFAASTQWYFRTERVWLDGKLLRRAIDYDLQPYSAWIGIDGSIDTTGKTVHMCYTAANLAIAELP